MNERELRWLAEAEEVAAPVVEAEQFVPFDAAQAVAEEGLLWVWFCSEEAYYREWRESHPCGA